MYSADVVFSAFMMGLFVGFGIAALFEFWNQ
jgi:hypothetical protein